MQVLCRKLSGCPTGKGRCARQHLLVDDGQTVLVAELARATVEEFRCRVHRREATHHRRAARAYFFDEAEVINGIRAGAMFPLLLGAGPTAVVVTALFASGASVNLRTWSGWIT